MKIKPALLTGLLITSLAALHAADPTTNSLGMKLMPIQPGTFTGIKFRLIAKLKTMI